MKLTFTILKDVNSSALHVTLQGLIAIYGTMKENCGHFELTLALGSLSIMHAKSRQVDKASNQLVQIGLRVLTNFLAI